MLPAKVKNSQQLRQIDVPVQIHDRDDIEPDITETNKHVEQP